jgi:hypothetical protein
MTVAMQTQFKTVSNLLTLVSTIQDGDTLETEYSCNVDVTLAGDSIWDCTLEAVTITGIYIHETDYGDGDIGTSINVTYSVDGVDGSEVDDSWRLYTDNGFSDAVSALLGTAVDFTEQGMQDDGLASMEL